MRGLVGAAIAILLLLAVIVGYSTFFTAIRPARRWWCGSANQCASSPSRAST